MAFEHDYDAFPELTNRQLEELQFTSPHVQITEDFTAEVVKVHDGDTVTLRVGWRDFDFPLRLLDIDAPELSEGGEETREWLKQKILGQEVQVLVDSMNRVGKYGRLLGRVFYSGLDIGQEEVYLGLAAAFGAKKEGEVPESSFYFRGNQWW